MKKTFNTLILLTLLSLLVPPSFSTPNEKEQFDDWGKIQPAQKGFAPVEISIINRTGYDLILEGYKLSSGKVIRAAPEKIVTQEEAIETQAQEESFKTTLLVSSNLVGNPLGKGLLWGPEGMVVYRVNVTPNAPDNPVIKFHWDCPIARGCKVHGNFTSSDPGINSFVGETTASGIKDPSRLKFIVRSMGPLFTDYKLEAMIKDFQYSSPLLGGIEYVLKKSQKVDLVDQHEVEVCEYTVGSSIFKTFQKDITETFTWGLNEKLGSVVTLKCDAKIPTICGIEQTITGSFELGANQQWTRTKSSTISFTSTLIPKVAGIYKMLGWVDIVEDVKLPFTAKVFVTATNLLPEDGSVVKNASISAVEIKKLLEKSWPDIEAKVMGSKDNDTCLILSVSGTMTGTYGLQTYTTFKKI